jgi:hypothetical protein
MQWYAVSGVAVARQWVTCSCRVDVQNRADAGMACRTCPDVISEL